MTRTPLTLGRFANLGTQKIDFRALLDLPAPFGNSLMIEGGASVIASALASPGLVDLVIVTVAPVFVGEGINVLNLNEGVRPFLSLVAFGIQ